VSWENGDRRPKRKAATSKTNINAPLIAELAIQPRHAADNANSVAHIHPYAAATSSLVVVPQLNTSPNATRVAITIVKEALLWASLLIWLQVGGLVQSAPTE
jgi:hypothetical protein